jgi:hypothetical protein
MKDFFLIVPLLFGIISFFSWCHTLPNDVKTSQIGPRAVFARSFLSFFFSFVSCLLLGLLLNDFYRVGCFLVAACSIICSLVCFWWGLHVSEKRLSKVKYFVIFGGIINLVFFLLFVFS